MQFPQSFASCVKADASLWLHFGTKHRLQHVHPNPIACQQHQYQLGLPICVYLLCAVLHCVLVLNCAFASGAVLSRFSRGQINQEPPTISRIDIIGNKQLSSQFILRISGHHAGETYTDTVIEDIRDRLFQSGYFTLNHPDLPANAVIVSPIVDPKSPGDYILRIRVDENVPLQRLNILGSGPLEERYLTRGYKIGRVYSERQLSVDLAKRIEADYHRKGYTIGFTENLQEYHPGFWSISLSVARVKTIQLLGVKESSRDAFLGLLHTKEGGWYNTIQWQKDLVRLRRISGDKITSAVSRATNGLSVHIKVIIRTRCYLWTSPVLTDRRLMGHRVHRLLLIMSIRLYVEGQRVHSIHSSWATLS